VDDDDDDDGDIHRTLIDLDGIVTGEAIEQCVRCRVNGPASLA
jgi:hypothetical protein